ncbi:MAG: SDR family NAD(P)-dependent oxidoreductase [Clostridiaceae bacterium]
MNYNNKVVLVTGGASGIGKSISSRYLKLGAAVIIADIDEEAGKRLEEEFLEGGYKAFFYKIDLKNSEKIKEMFEVITSKYRKVDILINNAGIGGFTPLLDITVEQWDTVINTNLRATFIASQQFAKLNQGTKYGRIINVSSTRHLMSEPNSEAYAASKGGIVSLTHALALSLSNENITVNSISPGWIQNTNYENLTELDHKQHPSLRVGKPDDIARACLFLTDEDNDFINGENIVIDGGMTKKMIYIE